MSDRLVEFCHDRDGRAGQYMHSYQSVWMAHWTQSSCNAAPQIHNHLSRPFGVKVDECETKHHHSVSGVEMVSNISKSAKRFRKFDARTPVIMNESLEMSLTNTRDERLGCEPFPIANFCRNSRSSIIKNEQESTSHMQSLGTQIDHKMTPTCTTALCTTGTHFPLVPAMAPPATKALLRNCHFQDEGMLVNPAEPVKPHLFFGDSSFAVSRSLQAHLTGSTSHVVPYKFDHGRSRFSGGRTAGPSSMCRQEEINRLRPIVSSKQGLSNTKLAILGNEPCNYRSHPAFLVYEEKMDNHSGKAETPYLKQNNVSMLNDFSKSNNQSPVFVGEKYQRMQNFSGTELFSSHSRPSNMTKSGKLHHGCCSQQRLPCSVHDAETMRICATLDSVEGLHGAPPNFSQTTRSLLITKKTDVNLFEENQIFRESRVSSQFEGNKFGDLHSLSSLLGHGQQGVKLQLLGSSTDSVEKENAENVQTAEVGFNNDSSGETDTMGMGVFKENHISGASSSPSNKDVMVDLNLLPEAITASSSEEVDRQSMTELPGVNVELPANVELSTSKTQSLDMELLVSHAEKSSNLKYNHCLDGHLRSEPSSRWTKRLKLSASDSFDLGIKNSPLGEPSSHEKVNKFFSKIMEGSISSSEPTLGKRSLVRNDKSSIQQDWDTTLSYSWIKRWRHKQAAIPEKKPEALVVSEPQYSKFASEDFQKKQFPSVAAMALMGKVMSGFQPCQFQKRGSFVVWNTKGF